MHLVPVQDFRMANYVCHRDDRPAQVFRRSIDHYTASVSILQQIEANAISVNIGGDQSNLSH